MKKRILLFLSICMILGMVVNPAKAVSKKSGVDPLYYVCIGDSVAAGYSLPDVNSYEVSMTSTNYKADTPYTYPHLVAEKLNEVYGYEGNLYDNYANMSTVAAKTSDVISYLENPDYSEKLLTSIYQHPAEKTKFHDLYVEEISKADLISINVGNNDLLVAALTQLWYDAIGQGNTKVEYNGYTVYDICINPILATVYSITYKMSVGIPLEADSAISEFKNAMEWYMSDEASTPLTIENITEALQYMQSDNLSEMMVELAKQCETSYPNLINDIQAINDDADLYLISYFAAFGNSLEVEGKNYTKDALLTEILKIVAQDTLKAAVTKDDPRELIVDDLVEEYTYPMIYLLLGTAISSGVRELNSWMKPYCEENGYTFVDIYNIPNENNLDPHPTVEGHEYIANQLINAMVKKATITSDAKVEGPAEIVKNRAAEYVVDLDKNEKISSVKVNGISIAFDQDAFTVISDTDANIQVITEKTDPDMPFTDVQSGKWYYNYVKEVNQLGLMTGTTATTFNPGENITRGQLATILYRMAGSPMVEDLDSFSDVAQDKYYTKAIAWCKESGVVTGYKDGTFKPAQSITRQELTLMLMRYAEYCDQVGEIDLSILDQYPDASDTSTWAKEAMAWAVENELISGDQGKLNPRNTATRAQCAKMILATYHLIYK